MVFEEHMVEFLHALTDGIEFMHPAPQAGGYGEIRKKHPRAYEKWTEEDDARLRAEFASGTDRAELVGMFQRQPSAIKSRLRKLGLLQ